ncbi:MAG: MoxR family ATPase [Deltaproteobacteria bacterium]|nr:MoxR family ATPase [Deltaproteobacteria bacterium]
MTHDVGDGSGDPGLAPAHLGPPAATAFTPTGLSAILGDSDAYDLARHARQAVLGQIAKRVVGQDAVVDHLLTALFAGGHALSIGVPGLAKTTLIQTLAETLRLRFGRVQFTPDLMPSDVTGTEVLEEERATGHRAYKFVPGPIFANILLADEINRTPPKTQAALLQAMQERHVTAGGTTHQLPDPFLVLATQNPIEQHGTYPLPEAQLDRFLLAVHFDYPTFDDELEIVKRTTGLHTPTVEAVLNREQVLRIQQLVRAVPVADHVLRHAVRWVRATRPDDPLCPPSLRPLLAYGASPRASQCLVLAGKARTVLRQRTTVAIEDLLALAVATISHRIVPSFRAEAEGLDGRKLVERLLELVPPDTHA